MIPDIGVFEDPGLSEDEDSESDSDEDSPGTDDASAEDEDIVEDDADIDGDYGNVSFPPPVGTTATWIDPAKKDANVTWTVINPVAIDQRLANGYTRGTKVRVSAEEGPLITADDFVKFAQQPKDLDIAQRVFAAGTQANDPHFAKYNLPEFRKQFKKHDKIRGQHAQDARLVLRRTR